LCPGTNIDDVDRGDFLEYHNLIRREIARGQAQNNAGKLNPAKEMYELVGRNSFSVLLPKPKYSNI
ncbi:hypothetical protein ANCDUO_15591, partial [Ancylostoma duodenale]